MEKTKKMMSKISPSIKDAIKEVGIKDGMTISFHHHLREGDMVLNLVMDEISKLGVKNIRLFPSSLLSVHEPLINHINNGVVSDIQTSGLRGKLAEKLSYDFNLRNPIIFRSHGGRAAALQRGDVKIDIAFIAASACDKMGNMNGKQGKSAFGSMGYAIVDAIYAKKVIAITDNLAEFPLSSASIDQTYVDKVVVINNIGNSGKISSGATKVSENERERKIARYASEIILNSGYVKNGFSFQAGSGGASLGVISYLEKYMKENNIRGGFISGGITSKSVKVLEEGLFEALLDTQTFDEKAVNFLNKNEKHIEMSASMYANPLSKGPVVDLLDIMILSATEIDLNFNVNVLTGSNGKIIGAIGGHPDTAFGAKLRIVTAPLVRKDMPIILDKVTTIVTQGENIDIVVTDEGIAFNPIRKDLIDKFKDSDLPIVTISELRKKSEEMSSGYKSPKLYDEVIGIVESREGDVVDKIKRVKK